MTFVESKLNFDSFFHESFLSFLSHLLFACFSLQSVTLFHLLFPVLLLTAFLKCPDLLHPIYNFSKFLNIVSNSLIITPFPSTPPPQQKTFVLHSLDILFWFRLNATWPGAQLSPWGSPLLVFWSLLFP